MQSGSGDGLRLSVLMFRDVRLGGYLALRLRCRTRRPAGVVVASMAVVEPENTFSAESNPAGTNVESN
jgi:hypothetical protein